MVGRRKYASVRQTLSLSRTQGNREMAKETVRWVNLIVSSEKHGCEVGDWVILPNGDIGRAQKLFYDYSTLNPLIMVNNRSYQAPLKAATPKEIAEWRKSSK